MSDQAQHLRERVSQMKKDRSISRIITVTSGKGGVGKSFFTVNISLALTALGARVLVIDADFGLANIDIMLGTVSSLNFSSVLRGEHTMREIIQEGRGGVRFISGGNGIYELLNLDEANMSKMLRATEELSDLTDIIIFDTGAGINDNILKLIDVSNDVVLITTPEPTSLVDAYAMIKTAKESLGRSDIKIVMNRVSTSREASNAIESLTKVARNNLGIEISALGSIANDPDISKTISLYTPLLEKYPKSAAAKNINDIARRLLYTAETPESNANNNLSRFFSGFFNK